jgi:hypothetical protein
MPPLLQCASGNTGVIDPADEALRSGAVSAAMKKLTWRRRLNTNSLTTAIDPRLLMQA